MKLLCALLLCLAACARDDAPTSTDASYEVIATGLWVPWALDFAPDGRLFVTERPGRIRVIADGQLQAEPWAVVPTIVTGEAGLMGIAVSPDFARDRALYVVATYHDGRALYNRVLRYTEVEGRGANPQVLIDSIPAAEFHAGSALSFGPDGALYITTGDAGDPGSAQDRASLNGKVLRYTPAEGLSIFTSGVRNPQGLAWSPDGQLFATDHGPSGFPKERLRRNHDELNALLGGRNYGWPEVAGASDDGQFVPPLVDWTPGIAPAGVAIYDGPHVKWRGSAFVAGLRGRQLRRVVLQRSAVAPAGWRVVREEVLFHEQLGRLRAVAMGPDGSLYFTTSNRDGRGDPAANDDRVLRLIPR